LIKADCGILLNSTPIKTWHCLKLYQMMLSSERALALTSCLHQTVLPVFLFGGRTDNKLLFSLVCETNFHAFIFFFCARYKVDENDSLFPTLTPLKLSPGEAGGNFLGCLEK